MSRYKFNLKDGIYAVVGWDRPFKSFFWQVYDGNDEKDMIELESQSPHNDVGTEIVIQQQLENLYEKYIKYGGEPIIGTRGADGIDYIPTIEQLVLEVSPYGDVPEDIKSMLCDDQYPGYQP